MLSDPVRPDAREPLEVVGSDCASKYSVAQDVRLTQIPTCTFGAAIASPRKRVILVLDNYLRGIWPYSSRFYVLFCPILLTLICEGRKWLMASIYLY